MRYLILCAAILMPLTLGACSSGPDKDDPRFKTTEGKALQDLYNARANGAITSDEYDDYKDEIADRYDD